MYLNFPSSFPLSNTDHANNVDQFILKFSTGFTSMFLCRPNLEELCDMLTDDINPAAKLPNYWTVNQGDLGMTSRSFGSKYKMGEHFTRFTRKN